MVPKCFYAIKLNGAEVAIPSDFEDLLEELYTTSAGMAHVVMYDTILAKALEEAGLIARSARGSYYATELMRRKIGELREIAQRSIYDSPVDCAEDAEALRDWDIRRQTRRDDG